jgi:hypothetical protein
MLGPTPSLSSSLAAERHARFAAEAADGRRRRSLRQAHPAPPCAALAAQLPEVVLDLTSAPATETEPAATKGPPVAFGPC